MTFPLNFTVGLHVFSQGEDDGYGNKTAPIFTPDLDQPGIPYKVFGWSDTQSKVDTSEIVENRRRVTEEKQLLAPEAFPGKPYDRIDLDDGQYEVVGFSLENNHGPWWNPRMRAYALQRVLA